MLEWFLRTTGTSDEFLVHLDKAALAFQHPVALVVGLVMLIPTGAFIFLRQQRNLATVPPALRHSLSIARCLILAILVFVLAGPYLKIDHRVEKKPIVALLFDHSQSMQLPAGPFEVEADAVRIAKAAGYQTPENRVDAEARRALNRISRAQLSQTVVQTSAAPMLAKLGDDFDVRFYSFAGDLKPIAVAHAARVRPADGGDGSSAREPRAPHRHLPDPPTPGGGSSHLGDAIQQLFDDVAGRPVAGVLLFSDGQNTGGKSPSEAGQFAGKSGSPVFAIPAGTSTRLRDVSIIDTFTSGQVSVGDTAQVAVTIESQGFSGRPVKVQLLDGETEIASRDIVLRDTEQQQVELNFEAKEPGAKLLTVKIAPQPEEPEELHANNSDAALLRVTKERLKVLFIDGLPRWDFRFLKNAIRRDRGLGGRTPAKPETDQPDIVLDSELRRRPADQQQVFKGSLDELAEYHTIIIGDISPERMSGEFLELLSKAVIDRGVGLVVAAGPRHTPHAFDSRLLDLLPVKLQPNAAGMEAPVYQPFRIELTAEGNLHEVLRLYDEAARSENVWSQMPPYFWAAAATRPAPGATVLAVNPSIEGRFGKQPLIATHFAGKGQVLFLGTDSTWLWRQNVGDRFFYKFWGQAIRFVARRDDLDGKQNRLAVFPYRVRPGESTRIELHAFQSDGLPRTEPKLSVQVAGSEKPQVVELVADSAMKGRYTGRFTPQPTSLVASAGEYTVRFEPGGGGDLVEAKFRVQPAAEELRHPNLNRTTLELLANSSGGQVVELPDLTSIADKLKGESTTSQLYREQVIWDNWLTLTLLVLIYSVDVGLRRLVGLS
ncbi:MAG: hypothetical protein HZA46_23855 [Planctomycetales bacterium]|nr:hypothetical protein [Planctomycetales bacterium]